jgi:hypothetical protein
VSSKPPPVPVPRSPPRGHRRQQSSDGDLMCAELDDLLMNGPGQHSHLLADLDAFLMSPPHGTAARLTHPRLVWQKNVLVLRLYFVSLCVSVCLCRGQRVVASCAVV